MGHEFTGPDLGMPDNGGRAGWASVLDKIPGGALTYGLIRADLILSLRARYKYG
jgi:hypothetical protein